MVAADISVDPVIQVSVTQDSDTRFGVGLDMDWDLDWGTG